MSESQSSGRDFLKVLGVTAGATVAATTSSARLIDHSEFQKLNPEQKEFMLVYENWMGEFIDAIRAKKKDPGNVENNKRMSELAKRASAWKQKLTEYMKEKNFALTWQSVTAHITNEI